jgi:hypothetical protein
LSPGIKHKTPQHKIELATGGTAKNPLMNTQQISIDELEVHLSQLKEVLQSILQSILFVRAFGFVKPCEMHVEFLDLYYVKCDDKAVDVKVEEKIDEFCASFAKRKTNKGQIVLSFYEKKQKNKFFSKYDLVCWEQWIVHISLTNSTSKTNNLEQELKGKLLYINNIVNENKAHIPPITTKDVTPFPFEISIPNNSEGGVVDMFWNMLKSPSPLLT